MTLSPIQYIFYTPTHSLTTRHTFIDNWTLAEKCLCTSLRLASLYIILHFYVSSHIHSTCNISRITHTHMHTNARSHSRPLSPKCISATALFIVFYVMEYVISHKLHAPHSTMCNDLADPPAPCAFSALQLQIKCYQWRGRLTGTAASWHCSVYFQ